MVSAIGEKRDISVVLDSISFEDDYEGDYSSIRRLIYTLNFTAKTYLFGPVAESPEGLIKKVQIDYAVQLDKGNARRELRYTATPQARKDYDSDGTDTTAEEMSKTTTRLVCTNSGLFAINDRIVVESETVSYTHLTLPTICSV